MSGVRMYEEAARKIILLQANAQKAGLEDDSALRDIITVEIQRAARSCIESSMPAVDVMDYCHRVNAMVGSPFQKDELNAIISGVWGEWERRIGRDTDGDPAHHLAALEREVRSWGKDYSFRFGIPQLDNAWGTLMPGEMAVVVGAPGAMKTSLAVKGISTMLREVRDARILVFSLDMFRQYFAMRFLLAGLGVTQEECVGMMREGNEQYLRAKSDFLAGTKGRLTILGNKYRRRWTIDGVEEQIGMKLPQLVVIDYLTCLKRIGQSDLDCVEECIPRLQDVCQKVKTKMLLLSQMGRASKAEQLKGATGGHGKGGGIVEEKCDAEIELLKDEPEEQDGQHRIIATVTKSRRGTSGVSFELDYKGATMEFTGLTRRVRRMGKKKPVFSAVDALRG